MGLLDAPVRIPSQGLSRVLSKLTSGQAISITTVGDSITLGSGATPDASTTRTYTSASTSVGEDWPSQVAFQLATRFAVSVTKTNRSHGGYTAADAMNLARDNPTYLTSAIADAADLYTLSFGHNDIGSDINTPSTGFPKLASWQALEHMIRRLRRSVPNADIVLMSESPYVVALTSTNAKLVAYNVGLQRLAATYGCRYIDCYAAITNTGSQDTYVQPIGNANANHPNVTGYALMATTTMAAFPAATALDSVAVEVPSANLYNSDRYTYQDWLSITTNLRTAGTSGFRVLGTFSNSGNAPTTSSTANDIIELQFVGDACLLRLTLGTGQGVVTIDVDSVPAYTNLDLNSSATATGAANTYFVPLTALGWGQHTVKIKLVSGSVTWGGFLYPPAACEWIPHNSARIVYTGTWALTSNSAYFSGAYYESTVQNDYFTADFVGTGIAANIYKYVATGGPNVRVTIDGGTEAANVNLAVSGVGTTNYPGGYVIASGLEYGHHQVKMRLNEAGRSIALGGLFAFDEGHARRSTVQQGVAYVGEAIVFPVPYTYRPLIMLCAADTSAWAGAAVPLTGVDPPLYASSATATGFTVAGPAGGLAFWRAEGSTVLVP